MNALDTFMPQKYPVELLGIHPALAPTVCRPLTFAWEIRNAASQLTVLQNLAAEATDRNSPRLVLPAATVAVLAQGRYEVHLNATNWLGASGLCTR